MFKLTAFLCIVACATSGCATFAQIEVDISILVTQTDAFDAAIVAFPNTGGTLAQALVSDALIMPTEVCCSDGQYLLGHP